MTGSIANSAIHCAPVHLSIEWNLNFFYSKTIKWLGVTSLLLHERSVAATWPVFRMRMLRRRFRSSLCYRIRCCQTDTGRWSLTGKWCEKRRASRIIIIVIISSSSSSSSAETERCKRCDRAARRPPVTRQHTQTQTDVSLAGEQEQRAAISANPLNASRRRRRLADWLTDWLAGHRMQRSVRVAAWSVDCDWTLDTVVSQRRRHRVADERRTYNSASWSFTQLDARQRNACSLC